MSLPRVASLALVLVAACSAAPEPLAAPVEAPPPPVPVATAPVVAAPAAPSFPKGWPYPIEATGASGTHGMVVTDATIATKVGAEMLKAGGNAVDAAVATAFALAVVYPGAGNLGGGGFLVARVDGQSQTLDFRETAPMAAGRDTFAAKAPAKPEAKTPVAAAPPPGPPKPFEGRPEATASRVGHLATGVPGSVAGLYEAWQKLGSKKKTWAELVAPAIELAEKGFVVDAEFSRSLDDNKKRMLENKASAALFFPGGKPLEAGSTWKNPELAKVLRRVAEKGPAGFYQGPVADAFAAEMKRGGGLMTKADLGAYKAKWRTPIEFSYRGAKVVSMPPPSSGGVTLAMMAHVLEGYDLKALGFQSPAELHYLFEAGRRAFLARNAKLGDPDFVKNPVEELLSPGWADAQRATIQKERATPTTELKPAAASGGAGPHTTHFSVVDGQGNAVALTTTLNWFYGSGVTVPGTGIGLNNEMDDFATVPGTANGYGLVQGEPNSVGPGKRMLSSMSPSIVLDAAGKPVLVLGGAGGPTIISAVFEELSNVVDFGLSPVAAINAPRFHEQGEPDVVLIEKGGIADETKAALERMGYAFKDRPHVADAPAIGLVGGTWIGAAEPRRMGALAVGY